MNNSRHPLLNDLVLSTLTRYVSPKDIPNFRLTCSKWRHSIDWKFRRDLPVNLASEELLTSFLHDEDQLFLQVFDNFILSELELDPLARTAFFDTLLPRVRTLEFNPDPYVSFTEFRTVLERISPNIRSLKIQIPTRYARRNLLRKVNFRNLQNLVWLAEDIDNQQDSLSVHFLSEFYKLCSAYIRSVECLDNSIRHLDALGHCDLPFLTSLRLGYLDAPGLELLKRNSTWKLRHLSIQEFGDQVTSPLLNSVVECFGSGLECLELGKLHRDGVCINLPLLPVLDTLQVYMSDATGYSTPPNNLPSLVHLIIKGCTVKSNVLCQFRTPQPVASVKELSVELSHEHVYENLDVLWECYPNIFSLTLGKPSQSGLASVWTLWRNLTCLKIMSGCGHIDSVVTGIPHEVCERMVAEQHYPVSPELVKFSGPSIRNLTRLQVLEINMWSECRSNSLSTLPTDVSVYYGLSELPNLRNLTIHRSLISEAASSYLRERLWSPVISPIQLRYDETIDAFQFHKNAQKLIKLLCRYPHQSLHNLPAYMQMLYVNNQLDL